MKERIAIDPGVHFGKPCIAGTRIPVRSVLELVREGIPFTEIVRDYYPDLDAEDVRPASSTRLMCWRWRIFIGTDAMKFLADQDVYAVTVAFLRNLDQDVVTASDLGLATAADSVLLAAAQERKRIFVTRDRDFGGLVFVQDAGSGVIYLRMLPSTINAVHSELERILSLYDESELHGSFVVVEPARHRIRKLKPDQS